MCMFNGRVQSVSNTNIFVGMTHDGKHQITIYSNSASSKARNAMVLPFPIPIEIQPKENAESFAANADVISVFDMKNYKDFFKQVEALFPQKEKLSRNASRSAPSKKLEVVQIGDYQLSVARCLADVSKIDKQVFDVSDNLQSILKKNYDKGFGFMICSFTGSVENATPIAYTHLPYLNGAQYFVPTRHEHGGEDGGDDHLKASYDHNIYAANLSIDASKKKFEELRAKSEAALGKQEFKIVQYFFNSLQNAESINVPQFPALPCKTNTANLTKFKLHGIGANDDLIFVRDAAIAVNN